MNRDKELYRSLRGLSWDELWLREVPRFNAAARRERLERVAVVRAVGVVFSKTNAATQLAEVKAWLRALLNDPQEKIRRYAIAALPKLPRDASDEAELIALAKKSVSDRERQHLSSALSKIGGEETLRHAERLTPRALQRVTAAVARRETPSAIKLDALLTKFQQIEILLRGRAGLETFVRDEVTDYIRRHKKFRVRESRTALVILKATAAFTLADIFSMRCFDNVAFSLPPVQTSELDQLAETIASRAALDILRSLTNGPIRYRLDFTNKGHQRAAIRELAERIYRRQPDLINGGGETPWTVEIHSGPKTTRVVLVPKVSPDPRFIYRRRDIPAASHPPLAACMARLAGSGKNETVWDPFCGSGLELIERSLLGNVAKIIGTDLSAEALEIAKQNIAAANFKNIQTQMVATDFRNFDSGPVDVMITNPPMGKRVPIPNLRQLIGDLFNAAAAHLKPGGCLVFANPLSRASAHHSLKREFSQLIDFGGFHCCLEKYIKH
jgi:23S rRNA G2445 N2-methylase RlmL